MVPKTTSSEIGKLIADLSNKFAAGKKVEPWKPGDFISLIVAYKDLIAGINTESPAKSQNLSTDMQEGRPGAYEEMCANASKRG